MRKEIEWLIDRYGERLEKYREDAKTFGGQFRAGVVSVYETVLKDLQSILIEADKGGIYD